MLVLCVNFKSVLTCGRNPMLPLFLGQFPCVILSTWYLQMRIFVRVLILFMTKRLDVLCVKYSRSNYNAFVLASYIDFVPDDMVLLFLGMSFFVLLLVFCRHALLFEGMEGEYNIPLAANAKSVREFDEGLTRGMQYISQMESCFLFFFAMIMYFLRVSSIIPCSFLWLQVCGWLLLYLKQFTFHKRCVYTIIMHPGNISALCSSEICNQIFRNTVVVLKHNLINFLLQPGLHMICRSWYFAGK